MKVQVPQLLSPHAVTTEAHAPSACALKQKKPPQWEAHEPQKRAVPTHPNQRKPTHSNEDPAHPKIKKINLKKNFNYKNKIKKLQPEGKASNLTHI